jgi:hypothetical protein
LGENLEIASEERDVQQEDGRAETNTEEHICAIQYYEVIRKNSDEKYPDEEREECGTERQMIQFANLHWGDAAFVM